MRTRVAVPARFTDTAWPGWPVALTALVTSLGNEELGALDQGVQPPLPQDMLNVQAGTGRRGGQGAEFEGTAERPRIRRHPLSMH
jgi:hypothetical protein